MPGEWTPGAGGLYVPDDRTKAASDRINAALTLTVQFLNGNGIALAADRQALAPEVFRLILHEGLVE